MTMIHKVRAATVVLLCLTCWVSGSNITCTLPVSVFEGESVSLVCSYNENLERNRQDLYIEMNNADSGQVIVAICAWGDSLQCDLKPGYNLSIQGHNVTLTITSAQPTHAGNYKCLTLPPKEDVQSETCSLSVESTGKPRNKKVTCFAPSQLSRQEGTLVNCIIPDSMEADYVALERSDHGLFTNTVELLRCTKGSGSCANHTDGCHVKSEHSVRNGNRVLSARVFKPGRYVWKAGLGATHSGMCTMDISEGSEQSDPLDGSLHMLTGLLYAILGCFVVVFVFSAIFLFIRLQKSKNWSRARSTSEYSAGLLDTHSPIYKKPLRV